MCGVCIMIMLLQMTEENVSAATSKWPEYLSTNLCISLLLFYKADSQVLGNHTLYTGNTICFTHEIFVPSKQVLVMCWYMYTYVCCLLFSFYAVSIMIKVISISCTRMFLVLVPTLKYITSYSCSAYTGFHNAHLVRRYLVYLGVLHMTKPNIACSNSESSHIHALVQWIHS